MTKTGKEVFYTEAHVNMMYWHWACGVKDLGVFLNDKATVDLLNYMSEERVRWLKETFNVVPSFKLKFSRSNGVIEVDKSQQKWDEILA